MTAIFLHNWDSKEAMIADFEGTYGVDNLTSEQIAKYDHVDVILASYGTDNYTGDAFVLFRNKIDGELYEIHGSHCSCYGLEGQWKEEFCDIESLKHRVTEGDLGSDEYSDNVFKDEIRQVIHNLVSITTTSTTEDDFITLPNSAIQCIWKCQDTGEEVSVTPNWYEQNGTPITPETGQDMVYLRTVVNRTDYNKAVLQLANKETING